MIDRCDQCDQCGECGEWNVWTRVDEGRHALKSGAMDLLAASLPFIDSDVSDDGDCRPLVINRHAPCPVPTSLSSPTRRSLPAPLERSRQQKGSTLLSPFFFFFFSLLLLLLLTTTITT